MRAIVGLKRWVENNEGALRYENDELFGENGVTLGDLRTIGHSDSQLGPFLWRQVEKMILDAATHHYDLPVDTTWKQESESHDDFTWKADTGEYYVTIRYAYDLLKDEAKAIDICSMKDGKVVEDDNKEVDFVRDGSLKQPYWESTWWYGMHSEVTIRHFWNYYFKVRDGESNFISGLPLPWSVYKDGSKVVEDVVFMQCKFNCDDSVPFRRCIFLNCEGMSHMRLESDCVVANHPANENPNWNVT